jgi:bacterial/archaeal transporter family-2 protein
MWTSYQLDHGQVRYLDLDRSQDRSLTVELVAAPLLLTVGALLALQAGANVQLSAALANPVGASALQLTIGAGLLIALAAVVGSLGAAGELDDARAWHLVGGLGSAIYITAGILLFPRFGAVATVGLFITGQMLASLVLDGTGALGVEREPIRAVAVAGAAAVLAGVVLIVRAQGGAARGGRWIALALTAGAALPVQGAINARLRADLDAPITAGAWSFVVAATAMLAVLALAARRPRARLDRLDHVPWWGWLGGLCGATYVTSVFLLIPEIGVAPTIALTVAGQQIASVFVDRHDLLRLPRRPITRERVLGVLTLLAGVAMLSA